jgi:hypothetical protein
LKDIYSDIYNETAENILGIWKRKHIYWITAETASVMDERRKLKEEISKPN